MGERTHLREHVSAAWLWSWGALLVLLSCFATLWWYAAHPPPPPQIEVLQSARTLPAGVILTADLLHTRTLPASLVPEDAVHVRDRRLFEGLQTAVEVPRGSLLRGDMFRLPAPARVALPRGGEVAYTLPVDPEVAAALAPGARVHVVATHAEAPPRDDTAARMPKRFIRIIQHVGVLDVQTRALALQVSAEEVASLELFRARGPLTVIGASARPGHHEVAPRTLYDYLKADQLVLTRRRDPRLQMKCRKKGCGDRRKPSGIQIISGDAKEGR